MLIILFGLPGAGKTYIGKLLQKNFGFNLLEGDNALTQVMQTCITDEKPFTQPMRDNFTKILINRINVFKKTHGKNSNIVLSQALFKKQNRDQIRQVFPDALFVHVSADIEILKQRLINRGDKITPEYSERLSLGFEMPIPEEKNTIKLINNTSDKIKTIEECIKTVPGLKVLSVEQEKTKTINLTGKKVIITAGPTREYLDPVRYITNESSGKMGYELAEAFIALNANVILVSGPTQLKQPTKVNKFISVESAKDMYHAVMAEIADADIFIGVAAVADYSPVDKAENKLKKGPEQLEIKLTRNPDILSEVADYAHANKKSMLIVGFAAETNNLNDYALTKLITKNVDMICANQVGSNLGFSVDTNQITIFKRNNEIIKMPTKSKLALAQDLAQVIGSDYICLSAPIPPIYPDTHDGINPQPEPILTLRGSTKKVSNYYLNPDLKLFEERPDLSYQDIHVKAMDENSDFSLRFFRQTNSKHVPTILYLPGTGFSRMIHAVEFAIARKLFEQTKCNVLLVNYRLAPENKFPKALLDAYVALEYINEQANELQLDKTKIIVLGYSSGAALAVQLTDLAHISNYPVAKQILLSPITDFSFKHNNDSEDENKDRFVKPGFIKALYSNYLPENVVLTDAKISPYYQTFESLSPSLILVGSNDRHRSDVEAFAEKLSSNNRQVEKIVLPDLDHCSFWDNHLLIKEIASSINKHFKFSQSTQSQFFHNKEVPSLSFLNEENPNSNSSKNREQATWKPNGLGK